MKKLLSAIAGVLSLIVVFASISIVNVFAAYEMGDADRSGKIDEKDVLWIRKYLVKEPVSGSAVYADFYQDGVVDMKDVFYLRRKIAGIDDPIASSRSTVTTADNRTTAKDLPVGVDPYYYNRLARLTTINSCANYTIAINQLGYATNAKKIVKLIEGRINAPTTANSLIGDRVCYVVNEDTKSVVYTAKTTRRTPFDKSLYGTTPIFHATLDISGLKTPGTYRIYSPAGYSSKFVISDNPYAKVVDDLIMGLYYQRCGDELSDDVIKAYGDYLTENYGYEKDAYYNQYHYYARPECHLVSSDKNKGAEVEIVDTYDSVNDRLVTNKDDSGKVIRYSAVDFAYGLHDAGDYGRYTQPAAQTVCDLLYAYELTPDVFNKLDVVQDTNGKGEKDNLPDILDHARWEAKFLLNMQSKSGLTKGGFYFKICTATFASAQGCMPDNDYGFNSSRAQDRYQGLRVLGVNIASTSYAASALAACYNTFKDIDPEFAQECLKAAEEGFKFYRNAFEQNTSGMSDKEITLRCTASNSLITSGKADYVGGGPYGGDSSEGNDSMWHLAAALYRATGDNTYLDYLKESAPVKNSTVMSAHNGGGYGSLAVILMNKNNERDVADIITGCTNAFNNNANSGISNSNSAFFNYATDSAYSWGSNPRISDGIKTVAVFGTIDSTKSDYLDTVRNNLSYMLGVNPENWCFISGLTEYSSKNIHHTPSDIVKRRSGGVSGCVPGLLAGGYTTDTSFGSNKGYTGFYYEDNNGDYVANEVCVYWNSSVIFTFSSVVNQDIANS